MVPARTISTTSIVSRVGDPKPVDEPALDAEPLEHLADLRPAAVHDDRVDADLLQQDDVAGEGIAARGAAHRMPAILDDEGVPGIAPHIGQRLGQNRGLDHRVRVLRCDGGRRMCGGAHGQGELYRDRPPAATAEGAEPGSAKLPSVARRVAMPVRSVALVTWISGCAAACVASSAATSSAIRGDLEGAEPVRLGQHHLIGDAGLVEHAHQRAVDVLQAVPRIDQQADAAQRRAGSQISPHQPGPALDRGLRRFGIAVARQVDQHQHAAEVEEIDLPRAARRVRGARQHAAPGQRVDKARLADIGAAGEGDLGQPLGRQPRGLGGAGDEAGLAGEEAPPGLDQLGLDFARRMEIGR